MVRVFVSSTFDDFKAERDALAKVFSDLDQLCRSSGSSFLAVDLRWGVSPEAWRDRQTAEICLDEVRHCLRVSPRLSFLALLGDRYGSCPLPSQIPADELEAIRSCLLEAERALVDRWYTRDDNAVPPEYRLEPIKDPAEWAREEGTLRDALLRGTEILGWTQEDLRRARFEMSFSHQEIRLGILDASSSRDGLVDHAFCYRRAIHGLPEVAPEGHPARVYASYRPDGERDAAARERLDRLAGGIAVRLPAEHRTGYAGQWTGRSVDTDLEALCRRVREDLQKVITDELDGRLTLSVRERALAEQAAFGQTARAHFVGQAGPLAAIRSYLENAADHRPLTVSGAAGVGKTTLLAQAAHTLPSAGTLVISRYLGTTPGSSLLRPLLIDLCQALEEAAPDAGLPPLPDTVDTLVEELRSRLEIVAADRPVALFLDAVDQLAATDGAHALHWLPQELPVGAKIVLTVLEADGPAGDAARSARIITGPDRIILLEGLTDIDPGQLLTAWLAAAIPPRKLRQDQMAALSERFRAHPRPLFLKLLAEPARAWCSGDPLTPLPHDGFEAIQALFDGLMEPARHGEVLVRAAVGYLAAARRGLSDIEMLELLSADPKVMADFVRRSPTERTKPRGERLTRLPAILWLRFSRDLGAYLTERSVAGGSVLDFYHRQLRQVAETRFLTPEIRPQIHAALAAFFVGRPDFFAPGQPNARKADELPYHLLQAGRADEFAIALAGEDALPFLEAKAEAGLVFDLIEDLTAAAKALTSTSPQREVLELLAEAVRRQGNFLARHPEALFQCLWNQGWWSAALRPLLEAWRTRKEQSNPGFSWLRSLQAPPVTLGVPGWLRLVGHVWETDEVAFEPGGERAVSRSYDDTVRIWDLHTGRELHRFECSTAIAVAFTTTGPRVLATGEDQTVEVWDPLSRARLFATPALSAERRHTALSGDGRLLAVAAWDEKGFLYNRPDWPEPRLIEAQNEVFEVEFIRSGGTVVPVAANVSLRVWDVSRGDLLLELPALEPAAIQALAFLPEGELLAFGLSDGTVRIWDLRTLRETVRLPDFPGFELEWPALLFSPGGEVLGVDFKAGLLFWSLESPDAPQRFDGPLPDRRERQLAFRPDGHLVLAFWKGDQTICVVDMTGGQLMGEFPAPDCRGPSYLFLAQDGSRVGTIGYDQSIRLWSLDGTAAALRRVESPNAFVFSPDGSWLATAQGERPEARWSVDREEPADHSIGLWNPLTGAPFDPLEGHSGPVRRLWFLDEGRLLSRSDHELRLWNLGNRQSFANLPEESRTSLPKLLPFAKQGEKLWLIAPDYDIRLWTPEDPHRPVAVLHGHEGKVTGVAFDPAERRLASSSQDGTVRIWDVLTGRELACGRGHEGQVLCVAFSADGSRVASGGKDRTVRLWDAHTGEELMCCRGHENLTVHAEPGHPEAFESYQGITFSHQQEGAVHSVDFSPDGRYLASGAGDETVRVWEITSGRQLVRLPMSKAEHRTLDDMAEVRTVKFTSEDWIAAFTLDGHYTLWDWRAGERVKDKPVPRQLRCRTFSPDGKILVFADAEVLHLAEPLLFFRVERVSLPFSPVDVAFTSDNRLCVAWSPEGTGAVVDCKARQAVASFTSRQGETVAAAARHEETVLIASLCPYETLVPIDLATGDRQLAYERYGNVRELALSPDGETLATLTGNHVRFLSSASGQELWRHRLEKRSSKRREEDTIAFLDSQRLAVKRGDDPPRILELVSLASREATADEQSELERRCAQAAPGADVPALEEGAFLLMEPDRGDAVTLRSARIETASTAELALRFRQGDGWIEQRSSGRILAYLPPRVERMALHPRGSILAVATGTGFYHLMLERGDP